MFPLALIALAVVFGAAKCYPPGTRVVVFIEGVYTEYAGEGSETGFDPLMAEFVAAGYEQSKLLYFSYNGGTVGDDGVWHPHGYGCANTDRAAPVNLGYLEAMLRAYKSHHPQAHFTLIGHSLGGYLAYLEGVREAARAPEQRLDIDVVVTLDAPLRGLDADKKLAIDFIACTKSYAAGADVVGDGLNPELDVQRQAELAALRDAGIRLATIGNTQDCLYDAAPCAGAILKPETKSQVLDGADLVKLYEINARLVMSHFVVLKHRLVIRDIVAFVGAP